MKQKLFFNKLWLRVGMIVAIMTTALTGTAWAEVLTYKLTIDASDFNTTSYAANNSEKTSTAVCTTDNTKTYEVKWTSNQVMKSGSNMQWQKNNGYIFNSTDLGTITNVTVTSSAGTFTTYYGTSVQPSSGTTVGGGFFQTKVGGATGTTSEIEVTFEVSALNPNDLNLSSSTLSFDLGGTTTSQLTNSGQADGTITWTSSNPAVATVDNSGNVTAVEIGTAVITASQAASSTYQGGTATCTVTVVDSRYTISDLTFTAKCNGSGTADDGAVWTVTSDASESNFDSNSGIHYGTSSATVTYLQLTTSNIMGTIAKVVVNTYDAQACAAVSVTVGGNNFLCGGATTATATAASKDYVFAGTGEGQIVVRIERNEAMKKAIYVKSVKVYYTPSTDPYITAEDVAIAYDATSGSIDYTLENATGNVSATITSGDWLTLGTITADEVPFTCEANTGAERTATVTLSFSGAENKVVTVTQAAAPVTYTTIPALFDKATEVGSTATDVNVTFGNWVVSGVSTNGKNVFVTDNSGNGFVIYNSEGGLGSTYAVGNILSGTISCSLKKNAGYAQLTGVSGLTITTGGTVTTSDIALASLIGVNTGALVSYENLTCSVDDSGSTTKYYLSDGTTTLQVYNALYAFDALESGKTYNITGIYQQYNSTKEILPRSAADIVEVQVQHNEYTLTVSTLTNVEMFVFDATDQSNALIDGEGSAQVYDGTQVLISVSAEAGFELESLIVDGNDVTSEIVSDAYTFTMPTHAVTVTATAVASSVTPTAGATVTYDFSSTDNFLTTYPGSTNPGTGSSNAVSTFYYTNGDEFAADGTSHYFNASGYFMLGKSGATLTLPAFPFNVSKISITGASTASESVVQNIYVDDDAVSTATTGAKNVTNEYEIAANKQAAGTIYTLKVTSNHNTQITKIEVFGYESVTVTDAGYATFASDNALDFTGSSIKAFFATESAAGTLSFTQVNKVPAGTGVLLYAKGGATVDVPVFTGAADDVTGNVFKRGAGAKVTYEDNDQNYILFNGDDGIGFYKANNNNVATNRAYIHVENGGGVKGFVINLEDDATGINEELRMKNEESSIYNLAGQRISKMQKGINIVNGKKILFK